MIDQASELRKLVLQSAREQVATAGPSPRLVVATSGQRGVGVTTIAVNLSVALAEHGSRVVIVDADFDRSDVSKLCGLNDNQGVGDVLVARRDIHEVLQRGPAGIQVVPGLFAPGNEGEWSETAQRRLLRQLRTLGRHAEVVVLDAGSASSGFLRRCCEAADQTLLVTTADPQSVMDTYARVKTSVADLKSICLQLVVNQCSSQTESVDVHRRIDHSCQRFLGHQVQLAATIPMDPQVSSAAARAIPFVLGAPNSVASRTLGQLADAILRRRSGRQESSRKAA